MSYTIDSFGGILMKRFVSIFLVFVLSAALFSTTISAASGSLSNFRQTLSYMDGQFQDVASDAWYAESVKKAFELELVKGTSSISFSPAGTMTIAQTITLASRLHCIYTSGSADFEQTDIWYQVYVDYALENQIIRAPYSDYTMPATRSEFAKIMANSLPKNALPEINSIDDDAIPDVPTCFTVLAFLPAAINMEPFSPAAALLAARLLPLLPEWLTNPCENSLFWKRNL